MNFSFYSCLFYVDHLLMKKLELLKSNVDGKYILISTPNELFFLSVEIFISIAKFKTPFMTDFRDILYFYPEKKKKKTRAVCKKLTFLIKEFCFCHIRKNIVCTRK